MALLEDFEIDSLHSVDVPLPNIVPQETHTDTLNQQNLSALSDDAHSPRATLRVPKLLISAGDSDGEDGRSTGDRGVDEDRPRSVLSFLLSRAKSALSSRSNNITNLPTNVRQLLKRFADRTRGRRQQDSSDDELSSSSTSDPEASIHSASIKKRLDSLAGSKYGDSDEDLTRKKLWRFRCPRLLRSRPRSTKPSCNYYMDPHGDVFLFWMGLVCLAYVYNAAAIPVRVAFGDTIYSHGGLYAWLVFDYLFDVVYILDIVLSFGVLESNLKVISRKYFTHWAFWLDLLSLTPLDVLYILPALRFSALLRIPRLLKLRSLKVFLHHFESNTSRPHIFRVAKLVCYLLYIIHIYTCVFYLVSRLEGFAVNEWVYDGRGNSYLRSFYWATLTVATIHDLEERNPTTSIEYIIEMFGYLFGVFIIAVIIGEIRNIIEAANSQRFEVYRKWDRLKEYMQLWRIPKQLQGRIQAWYDYALSQRLLIDENRVLGSLPRKTQADLAIHVHLNTLCRVALFQGFEKTLLRELVLKLRPVLFVPGDYICKKGEIGKEMYIVGEGLVQVIGGVEGSEVLAELGPGSVFGEISLLAVGGGNRRTAHVRSKGFSSLFVLSKRDLHETLVDYPDAQETLKKKARYLLRQDKKREYRRSQAHSQPSNTTIHNSHVAKAAVTAFTTAAKAARERAAASKLQEERERALKRDKTRTCQVQSQQPEIHVATVHEDSASSTASMAFRKTAAAARIKQFTTRKPASQITGRTSLSAAELGNSSMANASGVTYSSLWPSARELTTTHVTSEHPSSFASEGSFLSNDSSTC